MARTYKLNDGELVTCLEPADIPGIIEEKLSEELAKDITYLIHTQTEAEIYAERKIQTDLDNYEEQLYNYQTELDDIANVISSLIYNLKTVSRINKSKLLNDLEMLEDEIRSYL